MPENTIGSSAHRIQLDIARSYKREEVRVEGKIQQEGSETRSRDQGVEVNLSQQAQSYALSPEQVVAGAGETERTKLSSASTSAASTSAATRAPEPASEQDEPKTTETAKQGSVVRQYNQSANEALGTLIDIRS